MRAVEFSYRRGFLKKFFFFASIIIVMLDEINRRVCEDKKRKEKLRTHTFNTLVQEIFKVLFFFFFDYILIELRNK